MGRLCPSRLPMPVSNAAPVAPPFSQKPIGRPLIRAATRRPPVKANRPRKPLRRQQTNSLRSEEHTSELQSLMRISYAVFCLKKKTITNTQHFQKQNTIVNIKD